MVSLTLVNVVMFAFLSLLCGAIFLCMRRQSALAWLALALFIASVETVILGHFPDSWISLAAIMTLVPAAYVAVGQSIRALAGEDGQNWAMLAGVTTLVALSLLLMSLGVPHTLQTVPFQFACVLALGESIHRLGKVRRNGWDLVLMCLMGSVAAIFLIRVPLYPVLFGLEASWIDIRYSGVERLLLTASALLSPPAVFLLLARIIGNVIAAYRSGAERDGLTGLYNRRALDEMAGRADAAGGTVIFCDIDHFKYVNDHFGHHVGDQVIIAFARMIEHTGHLAARIGGEEFVLVLSGKSATESADIAEMIRSRFETMQHPDIPEGRRPTASFGVAAYCPGMPPVSAFVKADGALYGAKEAGRNRVVALGTDGHWVGLEMSELEAA